MVLQLWSKEHESDIDRNMPTTTTTTSGPSAAARMTMSDSDTLTVNGNNANSNSHKKKKGLSLGTLKSPFKFMGTKTHCRGCRKKCSGEVLRVNDFYFHSYCFKCHGCQQSLSQGGFFTKDKDYYCSQCYQTHFGTRCSKCGQFVEGEVVSALGKTFHQNCFTCASCSKPFPTGERVTFTGKSCLCQKCVQSAEDSLISAAEEIHLDDRQTKTPTDLMSPSILNNNKPNATSTPNERGSASSSAAQGQDDLCAGCGEDLKDGQALMALDKQYHVWCFKCRACSVLLHGEYMGKDGHPYCEKDYQQQFGVKCTYCRRFISGKVLQAGDNNHFHPTCARCTKCGEPFGDGEEMFLQGAAIWHPRCGPGPEESGGFVLNGFESTNATYQQHPDQVDVASMASAPYYGSRASSPGLRHYDSGRFSRSTTHVAGGAGYSGLYSSNSTYSLRRPIEPGDKMGSLANINHFHVPASRRSSLSRQQYHQLHQVGGTESGTPLANHRPISCPPKPGYTHMKSATLPNTPYSGSHFSHHNNDDLVSQQSFRTDYTTDSMRPSHTYSHGFAASSASRSYTPTHQHFTFSGEYKIFPLHVLFTSNYKLPPDLDRCNLEKHLSDADFQLAFNMSKRDFYVLPLWRRNDMKRRIKLF